MWCSVPKTHVIRSYLIKTKQTRNIRHPVWSCGRGVAVSYGRKVTFYGFDPYTKSLSRFSYKLDIFSSGHIDVMCFGRGRSHKMHHNFTFLLIFKGITRHQSSLLFTSASQKSFGLHFFTIMHHFFHQGFKKHISLILM